MGGVKERSPYSIFLCQYIFRYFKIHSFILVLAEIFPSLVLPVTLRHAVFFNITFEDSWSLHYCVWTPLKTDKQTTTTGMNSLHLFPIVPFLSLSCLSVSFYYSWHAKYIHYHTKKVQYAYLHITFFFLNEVTGLTGNTGVIYFLIYNHSLLDK